MARTKKEIIEVDEYGISITEIHKVLQNDPQGILRYIITQHPLLQEFYLYKIEDGKATKIEESDNPMEFKKLQKVTKKWREELDKIQEREEINAENSKFNT